ncbi:hypothetical protein INT43_006250 [Umbelopsis isabellina]|uniref:Cytochrome P450 n=1 Tax=Mortierella isabellina TaxID=91625 RepID=A0A8H7UEZ0_MORIS|nr:hypothetical protein INT43_006250 [Umbelopsis isabellina]
MSTFSVDSLMAEFAKDADHLRAFYSQRMLSYLASRSKATYIATAIAAIFSFKLYKMSRVPKNLKHIPAVSFWVFMRSVLSGSSVHERMSLVYPVLANSPSGLYLVPSRGGWGIGVAGPQALKAMFLRKACFSKDDFLKSDTFVGDKRFLAARLIGTQNILQLNGSAWKKHRMIANPAFHRHMPIKLFGTLCEKMMVQFEMDGDGLSPVNIQEMMQRLTLDVIGLAGFGYNFESIEKPESNNALLYNDIVKGLRTPIFFFLPFLEKHMLWAFPNRQKQHKNLDILHGLYDDIIANKRKVLSEQKERNEDPEKDLLTLMIEAGQDDPSQALSNEELREDLSIFFIAGHDTTSNALSFAMYFLASNLEIQKKAREEVIGIMGDGADTLYPTEAQISEFKYLFMIIKETLRICPPIQRSQLRGAEEDTELAGVVIPKGVLMHAEIYLTHHNPHIWKDPEVFRPERFAPGGENEENARNGLALATFGGGARQCIGMNFSYAEQRVVLAMLLRKFTWSLPEDSIHKDHLRFTGGLGFLTPKTMHINFKKRF